MLVALSGGFFVRAVPLKSTKLIHSGSRSAAWTTSGEFMRTEISRDGQELLLHIPIHLLAEDIRQKSPCSNVNLRIFTAREREVFALLRTGKVNKEIAADAHISLRTVKFHLSNIYRKLRVPGRNEAIQMYG